MLLPPVEGPCVNDVIMPQGVYEVCRLSCDGKVVSLADGDDLASRYRRRGSMEDQEIGWFGLHPCGYLGSR